MSDPEHLRVSFLPCLGVVAIYFQKNIKIFFRGKIIGKLRPINLHVFIYIIAYFMNIKNISNINVTILNNNSVKDHVL